MNAQLERVLVTVKTYPHPSQKYDETVCTAGLALGLGRLIRLEIGRSAIGSFSLTSRPSKISCDERKSGEDLPIVVRRDRSALA
jgi:hypothetical protein